MSLRLRTTGEKIMSGDDKPKSKKRRLLRLVILLIALAVLALVVIIVISGIRSGAISFTNLFSPRAPDFTVDEYSFEVGRDRAFAHTGGAIAAVGSLGVQVLDSDGHETLRDSFRTSRPAIIEAGDRFLAFDIGGDSVRVFNASQILSSIETEGVVVSASINQNGWFCVVTQDRGSTRGTVTVYNGIGVRSYEVNMASGIALSAQLSPDSKNLAILNLIQAGSRITFYHGIDISKDDPDYQFDFPDGLLIDIKYLSNTDLLAISTDSLFMVDPSGNSKTIYDFSGKRLGGYALCDEFIALHLYDYGIGYSGRLLTLSLDGTILGEMESDREIVSMSSSGNSLTILRSDGITFLNKNLEQLPISGNNISATAANRVLALSEDAALATSDNSAVIIRRDLD